MARHRKHRDPIERAFSRLNNRSRRDDYSIATDLSDAIFEHPRSVSVPNSVIALDDTYIDPSEYREVEDRRQYHPARQSRGFSSTVAKKINVKPITASLFSPEVKYAFAPMKYAMVCVRRHMRAQVLHALNKTGKGSRFNKKPRRSETSKIRC